MLNFLSFNFKLMPITPKMLETGTQATSTSHQTPSLPEAQLAEIQTRPVLKFTKKKQAQFSSFAFNSIVSMVLIQHCILFCIQPQM